MLGQIKELYELYGAMVYRRCYAVLRNEDEALDAMQDVFVRLLAKPGKSRIISFSSYLYRMATNHCLNILKKRGAEIVDTDFFDGFAAQEDLEQSIMVQEALEKAFVGISPVTRAIADMKYGHGMKYAEISEIVGLSTHAVRKRLQVLRKAVHRAKEEEYDGE